MKLTFVVAAMVMLSVGVAWAGSGPAKLSCKAKPSEKSSVTLNGLVPESEETLEITLSHGASSIRMTDEDARRIPNRGTGARRVFHHHQTQTGRR